MPRGKRDGEGAGLGLHGARRHHSLSHLRLGYDTDVIAKSGLRLVVRRDVTASMAEVADRRRAARASRSSSLRTIEGDELYDGQQQFLGVAARVAKEGRLSHFIYVAEKHA